VGPAVKVGGQEGGGVWGELPGETVVKGARGGR